MHALISTTVYWPRIFRSHIQSVGQSTQPVKASSYQVAGMGKYELRPVCMHVYVYMLLALDPPLPA